MDLKQLIDRAEWCRKHECKPYIMRDIACWECEHKEFLIDYAAYCNQPSMFKKVSFEDYLPKRYMNENYKNEKRMQRTLEVYKGVI